MILFKSKKNLDVETSLEDINDSSVTLVTKNKSDSKGTYRVYVNGWKYNLKGLPVLKENRLKIEATYFTKGKNRIEIKTKDRFGNERIYREEFLNK